MFLLFSFLRASTKGNKVLFTNFFSLALLARGAPRGAAKGEMRRVVGPLPSRTNGGGGGNGGAALWSSPTTMVMPSSPSSIPMLATRHRPHPLPRLSPVGPSRASADSREAPQALPSSENRVKVRGARTNAPSSSSPSATNERRQQKKPRLRALVVVEGPSDARAVLRAVDLHPGCHSLGGATWARNKEGMSELAAAVERASLSSGGEAAVVLLLDPDAPGRVARGEVSRELCRRLSSSEPPSSFALYHAFIPPEKCRAARAVGGKQAGDVGVEHASPETITAALRRARRHRGQGGGGNALGSPPAPFSMRELEEARLATSFDAGSQQQQLLQQQQQKKPTETESESVGGGATKATASSSSPSASSSSSSSQKTSDRRRRFCDALGLGPCTGAQLLRALNEWGLTREDWEVGLKAAAEGRRSGRRGVGG